MLTIQRADDRFVSRVNILDPTFILMLLDSIRVRTVYCSAGVTLGRVLPSDWSVVASSVL